jgi:hypothetical protein
MNFIDRNVSASQKVEKALTLRRFRTLNDCRLQASCRAFRLFFKQTKHFTFKISNTKSQITKFDKEMFMNEKKRQLINSCLLK